LSTKYQAGMLGQQEAENFLLSNGYRILERNYRVRAGEVDLIARHEGYVIFVEVKFRKGLDFGHPCEAVGFKKQQRIVHTALHYITAKNLDNHNFRFDVLEVLATNEGIRVNHIKNAFDAF